jgi:hypothetical protein
VNKYQGPERRQTPRNGGTLGKIESITYELLRKNNRVQCNHEEIYGSATRTEGCENVGAHSQRNRQHGFRRDTAGRDSILERQVMGGRGDIVKTALAIILLVVAPGSARCSDRYPLTAHVVGFTRVGPPFRCMYKLRIDKLTYLASKRFSCDATIIAGTDVSARIEKSQLVFQLPTGKELKLEIVGSGE